MWTHSHNGDDMVGRAEAGLEDGAPRTSTSGAGKEKRPPQEAREQRGKRGAGQTSLLETDW